MVMSLMSIVEIDIDIDKQVNSTERTELLSGLY